MTAKHILIAEDEDDIRFSLRDSLEKDSNVLTTSNGFEAIDLLKQGRHKEEPIDLIISDLQMPNVTGLDLMDFLEENDLQIPLAITTGLGEKDMLTKLLIDKCTNCKEKPLAPKQVAELIGCIFRQREKERQLREEENKRLALEKMDLDVMLQSYRNNSVRLAAQIHSAVDAYKELVDIKQQNYGVNIAWRNRPLAALGGDFVDIYKTPTGCDIFLADVAGHDLGTSYHTVLLKAFFDENCRTGKDGASFFQLLNRQLLANGKNERMVTGLFLRINLANMTGELTVAAHPTIILCKKIMPMPLPVMAEGPVLGIFEEPVWQTRNFTLAKGDRLILHTDGASNASRIIPQTGTIQKLWLAGLDDLISKHINKDIEGMIDGVWNDVLDFCYGAPDDDMLLFGVEVPV